MVAMVDMFSGHTGTDPNASSIIHASGGKKVQIPKCILVLFLLQLLVETVLFQEVRQTETHQISFQRP